MNTVSVIERRRDAPVHFAPDGVESVLFQFNRIVQHPVLLYRVHLHDSAFVVRG